MSDNKTESPRVEYGHRVYNLDAAMHRIVWLEARVREVEATIARVEQWTLEHGAALVPTAGCTDSYGDDMREAKKQVRRLLATAPAEQVARIGLPKSAAEAVREYQRVGCSVWEMADALEGVEVYDVSEVVPLLRAVHGHDENSDSDDDVTRAWEAMPEQWKKLVRALTEVGIRPARK